MFRAYISIVAVLGVVVSLMTGLASAQEKRNLLGLPWKSMETRGSVMLCGGGELPDAIYDEFIRAAGGRRARIILIPSALPYENVKQLADRFAAWKDYDVTSFEFLHTDDPDEANDPDFVAQLEHATGVWIAGGAQSRLLRRYGGRKVESALRRVVARGGIVAGDSAGASVLSLVAIKGGSSAEATLDTGFGLLETAVIDCHFTERARHTRLLAILDEHPELIAIGLDEGSALVIREVHLRAMGTGRVTIVLPRGDNRTNVVYQMRESDEADLSHVSSPFGSGAPTLELLFKRPGPVRVLQNPKQTNSQKTIQQ